MERSEKDVDGRRLERIHERKRHKLHSHHPIFCGAVWKLQHLQKSIAPLHGPDHIVQKTNIIQFAEEYPGADLTPLRRLICGGCAGITSVTFTYPLDIVRTRLSIQSAGFAALGKQEGKLPGMWATMFKMYKTEGGILGLYRGIVPTIAGVAPYVSLLKQSPHSNLLVTEIS